MHSCLYFQSIVGHLYLEYQRNLNMNKPQTYLIPSPSANLSLWYCNLVTQIKSLWKFAIFSLFIIFASSLCTVS